MRLLMNAETLQILKMLYANENRQVFFLTTAGTCIWKNDISEPLKTEEDCIALLHTLQANTGIQTFWYHSLLYAAEILTSAELDCVILRISTEPVLTNIMTECNSRALCQNFLAEQRKAIFNISTVMEHIYNEVEAHNIGELEQESIFSDLNDVMHCCCRLMKQTVYYEELCKYADDMYNTMQPLELSSAIIHFAQNCRETLGHRMELKLQPEMNIWVLSHESPLCFCLLCLMTQLLSHNDTNPIQTLTIRTDTENNHAVISLYRDKGNNYDPETEPISKLQPTGKNVNQDYYLVSSVLSNFCKAYDAVFETIKSETIRGYQIKLPLHIHNPNTQLHAPQEFQKRSTFLNRYQIMLYDIADYQFY